jgi:hypothetical protein
MKYTDIIPFINTDNKHSKVFWGEGEKMLFHI